MKKAKLLLGVSLALTSFTVMYSPVMANAKSVDTTSQYESVKSVRPQSFNVKFIDSNGNLVQQDTLKGYAGKFVPTVNNTESNLWKADNLNLTVKSDDFVSAQTLDIDSLNAGITWDSENPTVIFRPVVNPTSFTVRFVDPTGRVIKENKLTGYKGINAPRLILDGELCTWKADCIDLSLQYNDYLNAQILDLDYLWTSKSPVVTFTATSNN